MTPEEKLILLKELIDEQNYPMFEDQYLRFALESEPDVLALARSLLIKKSSLPDIKLGDVTIKNPKDHFTLLLSQLRRKMYDEDGNIVARSGKFRTLVRADGQ